MKAGLRECRKSALRVLECADEILGLGASDESAAKVLNAAAQLVGAPTAAELLARAGISLGDEAMR